MLKKPKKAKPVKAWGLKRNGKLIKEAYSTREDVAYFRGEFDLVRVEIREVGRK